MIRTLILATVLAAASGSALAHGRDYGHSHSGYGYSGYGYSVTLGSRYHDGYSIHYRPYPRYEHSYRSYRSHPYRGNAHYGHGNRHHEGRRHGRDYD